MEKKARVTKVTKFDKVDNYGNTSFSIEFDNGDKGFYSTKTPDKIPFIAGNVADYVIEQIEKKDKTGFYNKIKVPGEPQAQASGGFQRKSVDPKVQLAGYAASYTKDLIVAGKVGVQEFEKYFEIIFTTMGKKI